MASSSRAMKFMYLKDLGSFSRYEKVRNFSSIPFSLSLSKKRTHCSNSTLYTQVDLGGRYHIFAVQPYFRIDCCFNRNQYIELRIGSATDRADGGTVAGYTGKNYGTALYYLVGVQNYVNVMQ